MNPLTIRPKRDWCLVLMDERKEQLESGLFLPVETGAEKVTEGAGTVLRLGPGDKAKAVDLTEGARVALRSFLKYANPVESDERWPSGARKEYFLMSLDDVMAVLAKDTVVGVFSRPSQHAVDSVNESGEVRMR